MGILMPVLIRPVLLTNPVIRLLEYRIIITAIIGKYKRNALALAEIQRLFLFSYNLSDKMIRM